jgi:hypothetical protein
MEGVEEKYKKRETRDRSTTWSSPHGPNLRMQSHAEIMEKNNSYLLCLQGRKGVPSGIRIGDAMGM